MNSIWKRILKDLKADPRKTTAMVLLAVVLVIAWVWAISQCGEGKLKKIDPPELEADSQLPPDPQMDEIETFTGAAMIPAFLSEAMPYEAVGRNPFKASSSLLVDPSTHEKREEKRQEGKTLAEKEEEIIRSFKVSCTVLGKGGAFAYVDNRILKEEDDYKGYIIKEIGEGYVVFRGKAKTLRVEVK